MNDAIESVESVDARTGQGLMGDRYKESLRRGPDYQVSLIESEAIEEFTKESGLPMTAGAVVLQGPGRTAGAHHRRRDHSHGRQRRCR